MLKKRARSITQTPSAALAWPDGLRPSPLRERWFKRFASMPPGMTIGQIVKRLKVPYGSAMFWAITFKYPFIRFKRMLRPASTGVPRWAASIDWSRTDRELAESTGLTRQRINQVRMHAAKRPTREARADKFREHLKGIDKQVEMTPFAANQIGLRFGIRPAHAAKLVEEAGIAIVRPHRMRRWTHVNWSLPNRALAEIWGAKAEAIYMMRRRSSAPPPRWPRPSEDDPAYRLAVKEERQRAASEKKNPKASRAQASKKAPPGARREGRRR